MRKYKKRLFKLNFSGQNRKNFGCSFYFGHSFCSDRSSCFVRISCCCHYSVRYNGFRYPLKITPLSQIVFVKAG